MTKNPFYNAILATAYIVLLVTTVFLGPQLFGGPKESVLYPMVMLSVLVFSAALMAYLFFYQPVIMLIDGQREKAVKLFLQTAGIFAATTIVLLLLALTLS